LHFWTENPLVLNFKGGIAMKYSMKYILLLIVLFSVSLVSCKNTTAEITITENVTTETTISEQDYSCSFNIALEVSNSTEQIELQYVNCLSYGTKPGYEFTADGICGTYDMVTNIDSLPSIEQTDVMDLIKGVRVNVSSIDVYSINGTLLESWNSWDERSTLDSGQYFIRISVNNNESDCYVSGYSIFIMSVNQD
jgi:hypothetical protein